ncbi:MAG TPA: hypothetical protein VHO01_09845 [Jatrophihabitans sp.]|nr:hypothetical protein [Jatrophihabitans sp.]
MTNADHPAGSAAELLAGQPLDATDQTVLDRVAALYDTIDPVPADLLARLQFALGMDSLEFELAVLQLDDDRLAAARADATGSVKSLTFTSDSLTTMLNIAADGPDRVRIDGWLAPAAAAVIELHQGDRLRSERADEDGRFAFTGVEHGLTRFTVRPLAAGRAPVAIPAVEL